jgi:hypothetical protein
MSLGLGRFRTGSVLATEQVDGRLPTPGLALTDAGLDEGLLDAFTHLSPASKIAFVGLGTMERRWRPAW